MCAAGKLHRPGGRHSDQLRPLLCEVSLLERADGSARWTQEGTCVLAAVHGPRQAQPRKEDAERAVIEVVFKPRSGLQGPAERDAEAIVREALEGVVMLGHFPRCSIMVALQVVSDDGGVLAVALNAACAALVDAGVPLRCMFSAVTCGLLQGGGMLVDPDATEVKRCRQQAVLAFCHVYEQRPAPLAADNNDQEVVAEVEEGALVCHACCPPSSTPTTNEPGSTTAVDSAGMTPDQLLDVFDVCRARCQQLAAFQHKALRKALA